MWCRLAPFLANRSGGSELRWASYYQFSILSLYLEEDFFAIKRKGILLPSWCLCKFFHAEAILLPKQPIIEGLAEPKLRCYEQNELANYDSRTHVYIEEQGARFSVYPLHNWAIGVPCDLFPITDHPGIKKTRQTLSFEALNNQNHT